MAALLQQVLERTEISKLPKAVQTKLERYFTDQQNELDGLKGHQEQFRVDSGERNITRLIKHTQTVHSQLATEAKVCYFIKLQ